MGNTTTRGSAHANLVVLDEPGRAVIGDLTAFISEKSFASTHDLTDAIITFLAARNDNPQRYAWKAKGEVILRKIDAARRVLAASSPKCNSIFNTVH